MLTNLVRMPAPVSFSFTCLSPILVSIAAGKRLLLPATETSSCAKSIETLKPTTTAASSVCFMAILQKRRANEVRIREGKEQIQPGSTSSKGDALPIWGSQDPIVAIPVDVGLKGEGPCPTQNSFHMQGG